MFTGIIEQLGVIKSIEKSATNTVFIISSLLAKELKVDQSIAHNGVCLTIEAINENNYQVTAVAETLAKTNAGNWRIDDIINLERAMQFNGRMDGHLVQGHVDTVATCIAVDDMNGSWMYRFQFPENFSSLMIEKGSVAINGTSLTAFDVTSNQFSVAIIPYTYNHTNINQLKLGDSVNIEFDMIGKYVARFVEINNK
ncbi:MAG: riboflavin synthase [Chitinophagaceae bacterium]|nr:riboflavin synthase [Chitinophagaceae bacterium]